MALILPYNGAEPQVSEQAWLAPTATLVGDVVIGPGSSVFYGAVLRGDINSIRVGADTNIQDNVTVHLSRVNPTVIGDRVSIGHSAVVHGCTIEDDCLIGMGAIVMNGATIGAGTIVAAGAVVTQGETIPPGSLVAGVPGKLRRELGEEDRAMIARNTESYRGITAQLLGEPG